MYFDFENDAVARVWDECEVSKHVFYRVLTSEMVLWIEFWNCHCALARVLDGSGFESIVFCTVLKHRRARGSGGTDSISRPCLFNPNSSKKHPEIALTLDQNNHFRRIAIQLLTSRTSRKSCNLRRLKQIYTENDASESAIQRPFEDPQKTCLNRTHSRTKHPFR